MGRNSKYNRMLMNQYSDLSDQELSYFLGNEIRQYMVYKKSCIIAQEILHKNGVSRDCFFDDSEIDSLYSKSIKIAELRDISVDIPEDSEIKVTKEDVTKRLSMLCYNLICWIDEHYYLLDSKDADYIDKPKISPTVDEPESVKKIMEVYRLFYNIMSNLSEEEILSMQENGLQSQKSKCKETR